MLDVIRTLFGERVRAPPQHERHACVTANASGHNRPSRNPRRERNNVERARLFSIIQAAGWPIWPLLLCSIAAFALVLERVSSLRTARVVPPKLLDEVISVTRAHLPPADVVNKLADNSVLGTVLATGLRAVIADPRINERALRDTFESAGRAAVSWLIQFKKSTKHITF